MGYNLEESKMKAEIAKLEAEVELLCAEAAKAREQARELRLKNGKTEKGS